MWKARTRVQSISWWARSPARNSFWLGRGREDDVRTTVGALPLDDLPHHVAGRGATRQGPRLEDQNFQGIHDESRDRRRLSDGHDRILARGIGEAPPGIGQGAAAPRNPSGKNLPHPTRRCQSRGGIPARPSPDRSARSGRRELAGQATGRFRGPELLAEPLALIQVAEHRFREERLRGVVVRPLELVVALREVLAMHVG